MCLYPCRFPISLKISLVVSLNQAVLRVTASLGSSKHGCYGKIQGHCQHRRQKYRCPPLYKRYCTWSAGHRGQASECHRSARLQLQLGTLANSPRVDAAATWTFKHNTRTPVWYHLGSVGEKSAGIDCFKVHSKALNT